VSLLACDFHSLSFSYYGNSQHYTLEFYIHSQENVSVPCLQNNDTEGCSQGIATW